MNTKTQKERSLKLVSCVCAGCTKEKLQLPCRKQIKAWGTSCQRATAKPTKRPQPTPLDAPFLALDTSKNTCIPLSFVRDLTSTFSTIFGRPCKSISKEIKSKSADSLVCASKSPTYPRESRGFGRSPRLARSNQPLSYLPKV